MAKRKKFKKVIKRYRRKIRYRLIYFLVQAMIFISNIIPRVIWLKICGTLGRTSYYFLPNTRKRVKKHLAMVYGKEKTRPEILKLSKQVFEMLGKNAGDVLRGFKIQKLEAYDAFRIMNGIEHVEAAHKKGKGVIFLTAHLGAFEFIATEFSFRGYKPYIIGTRMKDSRLNDLLWEQRNKLGATAIERGKDTVRLIKNLKSGGSIAILIDQDTKVKARFVNFLGIPCATPIGATLMAIKTGAAIVPAFTHLREDYKLEINCYPEVEMIITGNEETDYRVNTQRLNDVIEREIRKYPSQWVWMHERWKTKPGEEIQ